MAPKTLLQLTNRGSASAADLVYVVRQGTGSEADVDGYATLPAYLTAVSESILTDLLLGEAVGAVSDILDGDQFTLLRGAGNIRRTTWAALKAELDALYRRRAAKIGLSDLSSALRDVIDANLTPAEAGRLFAALADAVTEDRLRSLILGADVEAAAAPDDGAAFATYSAGGIKRTTWAQIKAVLRISESALTDLLLGASVGAASDILDGDQFTLLRGAGNIRRTTWAALKAELDALYRGRAAKIGLSDLSPALRDVIDANLTPAEAGRLFAALADAVTEDRLRSLILGADVEAAAAPDDGAAFATYSAGGIKRTTWAQIKAALRISESDLTGLLLGESVGAAADILDGDQIALLRGAGDIRRVTWESLRTKLGLTEDRLKSLILGADVEAAAVPDAGAAFSTYSAAGIKRTTWAEIKAALATEGAASATVPEPAWATYSQSVAQSFVALTTTKVTFTTFTAAAGENADDFTQNDNGFAAAKSGLAIFGLVITDVPSSSSVHAQILERGDSTAIASWSIAYAVSANTVEPVTQNFLAPVESGKIYDLHIEYRTAYSASVGNFTLRAGMIYVPAAGLAGAVPSVAMAADRDLAAGDEGRQVTNEAVARTLTFAASATVPADAAGILRAGSAALTLAAGEGVTLNRPAGKALTMTGEHNVASWIRVGATDTYILRGDLDDA